jgi:hypothetical protein
VGYSILYWVCCSGVEAEGCGVVVKGSAPITEEAIATPPSAETKASIDFSCELAIGLSFLSSNLGGRCALYCCFEFIKFAL